MLQKRGNEPRQEQRDRVEHESVEGGIRKGFFGITFRDDVHSGMTPGAGGDWSRGLGRCRGG